MSLYRSLREEMMAGGAVNDDPNGGPSQHSRLKGALSGLAVLALLIWLGISNVWSLVLVVGLLLSVFLHELGHFKTAGWAGMKRTQFFMGFGPKIWSMHRNGVEYGVRALPLGAFVRIVGMNNLDPVDEGDEQVAYSAKPYMWRLLVITAGSLMHIIIAVLIMMFVYTAGGRYQETGRIEVLGLTAGSPAAQAGITPGDEITSINGVILETSDDFRSLMAASSVGDEVSVGFIHQDSQESARVTLVARPGDDESGIGFLGVGTNSIGRQKLSLFSATTHMTSDLLDGMGRTIQGIGTILNPENQWSQLTDSQADPNSRPTTVVGITQVAGDIGDRDGLYGVLEILASINVFIGIFNLLPFLPFDGGHAAIATYERIRSRKGHRHHADVEKMWPLTVVVITLLLFLTFTGLYLDITRPF